MLVLIQSIAPIQSLLIPLISSAISLIFSHLILLPSFPSAQQPAYGFYLSQTRRSITSSPGYQARPPISLSAFQACPPFKLVRLSSSSDPSQVSYRNVEIIQLVHLFVCPTPPGPHAARNESQSAVTGSAGSGPRFPARLDQYLPMPVGQFSGRHLHVFDIAFQAITPFGIFQLCVDYRGRNNQAILVP